MKTRATVSKFLKNLAVLGAISAMAVSCGKDNTSGKTKNKDGYGTGIYNYPGYGNQYGNMSLQDIMGVVGQENPCAMGGQRQYVQIQLQGVNVNIGSSHLGVSPFGDMAVAHNTGGMPVLDLHICPRAGASGQDQLLYNPILEASQYCPVGQITAANVMLQGQVPYEIAFAPIHIPGTNRLSQVCNQQVYY